MARPRVEDDRPAPGSGSYDPSLDYSSIEEIEQQKHLSAQEQHDLVMLFRARTGAGLFDANGGLLRRMLREREDRAKEERLELKSRALAATFPCGDAPDTLAAAREFVKLTEGCTNAEYDLLDACGL